MTTAINRNIFDDFEVTELQSVEEFVEHPDLSIPTREEEWDIVKEKLMSPDFKGPLHGMIVEYHGTYTYHRDQRGYVSQIYVSWNNED